MASAKEKPDSASRLYALFAGNQRASGRHNAKRDRGWTEEQPLTVADWQAHLDGVVGCGSIPIQDDDHCVWACIDLDNHGSDEDLPIHDIDAAAMEHNLPLVMCRSKSGGVHAYAFFQEPQPCNRAQILLRSWAEKIGYPKAEVFPKQARLVAKNGDAKPFGNYVNMPYMGGDGTIRYAVRGGAKLSLGEFLDLAEKSKIRQSDIRASGSGEHPEAPPCIQQIMANGVAQGHRNETLYNISVYFRKMDPEGFEKRAIEANSTLFNKPLPRGEMLRTIGSAGRPDCQYRCNEDPIRSLCDRETCVKRKFGITPADADRIAAISSLPVFSGMAKYLSEPVRWELQIDGVKVTNISTEQLLDWRAMRHIIADRLTKVAPVLKPGEWERILQPLMSEARIVETPDDASINGIIRSRLREFAARADLMNRGDDTNDRKALLRGNPVVQKYEGDRMVMFRAEDLVNYLKRFKSEELKGINLWFAVKGLGVSHTKVRVSDQSINVWYLPVSEVLRDYAIPEPMDFKSEL